MTTDPEGLPANVRILEEGKRLSECMLWPMLEDFYHNAGIAAWKSIPYYPTCNTSIAEAYAEAIIAFLQDYLPYLQRDEPIFIIEMATGSGCFSFFLLRALSEKLAYFRALSGLRLRYVMTDFTENNVNAWEHHEELKPFIASGLLDFGVFSPEIQDTITLRRSGQTLAAGNVKNPILSIANYFFDSIRQDFFRIDHGKLFEGRVTLYHEVDPNNPKAPPTLADVKKRDAFVEVSPGYYDDPRLNEILKYYLAHLEEGSVLIPIGAFRCLRNLQEITRQGIVLLSSDKGYRNLKYMACLGGIPYTPHSQVFSYMVNYHAIGLYFRNQGGLAFQSHEHYTLTTTIGIAVAHPECPFDQTRYVIEEQILKRNPIKNVLALKELVRLFTPSEDADQREMFKICMSIIQLSNYDPYFFSLCGGWLKKSLQQPSGNDEDDLPDAMRRVRRNLHRSAVGQADAYHWLRTLSYELDLLDECLAINDEMLGRFGPESNGFYYRGAVNEIRRNYAEALGWYKQALELDPQSELAQSGISRTEAKLKEQGVGG